METNFIVGNKLIAEFRGFRKPIFIGMEENDTLVSNIKGCFGHYALSDLKFHYDWNWLMAVVEKIKGLISESEFIYRFKESLFSVNINNVWLSCIEFIKWYNQNKIS